MQDYRNLKKVKNAWARPNAIFKEVTKGQKYEVIIESFENSKILNRKIVRFLSLVLCKYETRPVLRCRNLQLVTSNFKCKELGP